MTRILAVTDRVGAGLTNGSQVFGDALLRGLARRVSISVAANLTDRSGEAFERCVAIPDGRDEDLAYMLEREFDLSSFSSFYNLGGTSYSCRVARLLRQMRPATPLVNHFQVNLATYAAVEGAPAEECACEGIVQSEAAALAERNLFPSFAELQEAQRQGWDCGAASVTPNAYVPADRGGHPELSERAKRFTFFAAARFSDYAKGADLLYRAFRGLGAREARLEAAGDEPRFLELLEGAPAEAWKYHGWLERGALHARMRACDCAVAPSRYEPFGMSALEAMAAGLPVIAMAVGGPAEIVHHGVTGWLCPAEEGSLGIRLAMEQALEDPERTRKMGQAARRTARQDYNLGRITRMVWTHLENVSAVRGRRLVEEWAAAEA